MSLLVSQTVSFFRRYRSKQESAQKENAAGLPVLVQRMSVSATCVASGVEEYCNIPANDRQIMAEMSLFPKRMML